MARSVVKFVTTGANADPGYPAGVGRPDASAAVGPSACPMIVRDNRKRSASCAPLNFETRERTHVAN
jgi:hypothetical protein